MRRTRACRCRPGERVARTRWAAATYAGLFFYVGCRRSESVPDPNVLRDRPFVFPRRLPASNVASQVRGAPTAGAARSSSSRVAGGPSETPRPSTSSSRRYAFTDDDHGLGKGANKLRWSRALRFSQRFDAVRRPGVAARAPRRAHGPRRMIAATEEHVTAKICRTSPPGMPHITTSKLTCSPY